MRTLYITSWAGTRSNLNKESMKNSAVFNEKLQANGEFDVVYSESDFAWLLIL